MKFIGQNPAQGHLGCPHMRQEVRQSGPVPEIQGPQGWVLIPEEKLHDAAAQLASPPGTGKHGPRCGRPRGGGRHVVTSPGRGRVNTANLHWAFGSVHHRLYLILSHPVPRILEELRLALGSFRCPQTVPVMPRHPGADECLFICIIPEVVFLHTVKVNLHHEKLTLKNKFYFGIILDL